MSNMDKDEVVTRLCGLASLVATRKFGNTIPADCVCEQSSSKGNFQFDCEVLHFMENAIMFHLGFDTGDRL